MSGATVRAVCQSEERTEPKLDIGTGQLRAEWGLIGDSHAGLPRKDRWQISLLAWEDVLAMNERHGVEAVPGSFAENLSTQGLETAKLKVGDRLQIGEHVILEVEQLGKPLAIAHTFSYHGHSLLPTKGIFCGVLVGGSVATGDKVVVLETSG